MLLPILLSETQELPCGPCALVVDDDDEVRKALVDCLIHEGWDAHEARNGEEALAFIRTQRPLVLILDIAMPVMDGLTFLDELRSDPEWGSIPVVVLTATNVAPYRRGAHAVLSKPVNVDLLLNTLRRVAGHSA